MRYVQKSKSFLTLAVAIPVVAIGGVNEKNILQLAGTGIDGAAVVSAIFAKEDKKAAAETLRGLAEQICRQQTT